MRAEVMPLIRRLWLALLVIAAATGPAAAQTFPAFTGSVVDDAKVMSPAAKAALTEKLDTLRRETKRQLVVATIADLQGYPVADYGYKLGRQWGVGLRDVDNGVVIFIAPNAPPGQRQARIEVGRGLEPILTDALTSVIIAQDMLPRLKAGDIDGGLTAGADAVAQQLRASPEEAKARTDAAVQEFDRTHRRSGAQRGGVPFGLIFWLVILAFVIVPMFRSRKQAGPWGQRHRGGDGGMLPVVLWSIANEIGRGGGGGSWGGGGGGSDSGGGGWGDGGFSGGGGGSFGGGGASGSW